MSSLETSVTLDDVFTVVEAKRVPLAPELAGYLALEIADGTDAGSGDVDPKTVFISEEGTVALVRPKKDLVTGEAEASIRRLLSKLLDASGSGTPALTTAAKRKPGNGLPALVEELEAALIPVNRSAGRRALARLAREVKRVLLGVGRNANVGPVGSRPPAPSRAPGDLKPAVAAPHARPALRKRGDEDAKAPSVSPGEPSTGKAPASARGESEAPKVDLAANLPGVPGDVAVRSRSGIFDDEAATAKRTRTDELLAPVPEEPPARVEPPPLVPAPPLARTPIAPPALPPPARNLPPPPAPKNLLPVPPPPPKREGQPAAIAEVRPNPAAPGPTLFGGDEVDNLLESFGVSSAHEDKQMARELKAIAGLGPTPPPPDATTLAELTKDVGKTLPKQIDSSASPWRAGETESSEGDSVEALLALADASVPVITKRGDQDEPTPLVKLPLSTMQPIPEAASATPLGLGPPGPALPDSGRNPAAIPDSARNLPPSPLFGGRPGGAPASAGAVPGAPASLRQVEDALPPSAPLPASRPEPRVESPRAGATTGGARLEGPAKRNPTPAPTTTGARLKADPVPNPVNSTRRNRAVDSKPRKSSRTGLAMLVFALFVLAGGSVAIWKFAPQVFTGKRRPVPTAPVSAPPVVAPAPRCKVALVLTEVPANAEILLRMGQAPVDVERMPVGTRLELVATAEGHAPRRAVIKAESPWDKGPDGKPRIEVPIQLDPSKAKPGGVDPWPAAEPGSQVGGSGAPGTVHVVSNVRGAEVWLLAGLGPEARIDQLRCDGDIDVLFAGPPSLRKRLHVAEKDIATTAADPQGTKVVTINASAK